VAERTAISWTDATFNPWNGCQRVSPGCENCYAQALDEWLRGGKHWGPLAPRQFFGDAHWNKPRRWNEAAKTAGKRTRVFCASTADVFEDRPELVAPRNRLFTLIQETPHLDWLLLTKRPENFEAMLPWYENRGGEVWQIGAAWRNVWLGVTAENDEWARRRIPLLRAIAARVRFVSYEPALGPIEWGELLDPGLGEQNDEIHWVIFGDESGRRRRPAEIEWARQTRDACKLAGVAFHFKQWCGDAADGLAGERDGKRKVHLPILDGVKHAAFPEVRHG